MSSGTELAVREGVVITPAERAAAASEAGMDSWLIVMKDVILLAEHICDTAFVPKAYRGNAPAAAAAILTGRELGLPPMTSLRHVQVVEGSPSLSAEYKRARVLAAGHRLDIDEHTTEACQVTGHRRGHKSVMVRFTIADARRAGLVESKPGHGPRPYITRPRRMLFARACTEVCDALFTDVTNGLPTTELLEAGDEDVLADVVPLDIPAAPEPKRVTAGQLRARRPAPQDTPPAPPHPPTAAEPPPSAPPGGEADGAGGGPALIASGQKSQIEGHFRRIGADLDSGEGWDEMLAACARLAGLAGLASLAELTQDEAAKIIGELKPLKDGEAGARALQALLRDGVKAASDGS